MYEDFYFYFFKIIDFFTLESIKCKWII